MANNAVQRTEARDPCSRPLTVIVRRISGPSIVLAAGFVYPGPAARARSQEVAMSGSTAKQKVLEAMEKLPADATVEDAIERLVLLAKIEQGMVQLDAGQGVEHSEAKRRLLR